MNQDTFIMSILFSVISGLLLVIAYFLKMILKSFQELRVDMTRQREEFVVEKEKLVNFTTNCALNRAEIRTVLNKHEKRIDKQEEEINRLKYNKP